VGRPGRFVHQEPGKSRGRLEIAWGPAGSGEDPTVAYLLRDKSLTYAGGVAWRRVFRSLDGGATFQDRQGDLLDFGATSYMATLCESRATQG
jgi:hypothetical protein